MVVWEFWAINSIGSCLLTIPTERYRPIQVQGWPIALSGKDMVAQMHVWFANSQIIVLHIFGLWNWWWWWWWSWCIKDTLFGQCLREFPKKPFSMWGRHCRDGVRKDSGVLAAGHCAHQCSSLSRWVAHVCESQPAPNVFEAQPELEKGDGPIVLVLAPTRELALQTQECLDVFFK